MHPRLERLAIRAAQLELPAVAQDHDVVPREPGLQLADAIQVHDHRPVDPGELVGIQLRLDAVRIQIDGQLVAHHIYSFKELDALRKGGMQRIYVGNVATGDHQLEVLVDGKLEGGADFTRTERFTFRKEVKPKMVGLTVAGSGNAPIALGEW